MSQPTEDAAKIASQFLAEAMQQVQEKLKKENENMASMMAPPAASATDDSQQQMFKNQMVSQATVEEYARQYALQMNILNYKAANTCFIDAVMVAKTAGIYDDIKDKVCPFPGFTNNVSLMVAPPPSLPTSLPSLPKVSSGNDQWKMVKKVALVAGLLGSGIAIPLALEKIFSDPVPPVIQKTTEPHNPDLSVEIS